MIERTLKSILEAGITAALADPTAFERFFRVQHNFTVDEILKMLAHFQANAPAVSVHYPRTNATFPLVSIILAREQELREGMFLGDMGGYTDTSWIETLGDQRLENRELYTSYWSREYHLVSYALHPDVCLALHELVKYFLFRERETILQSGAHLADVSGLDMAQLATDTTGPDFIYRRQLIVRMLEPFAVYSDILPPISDIAGIAVSDGTETPNLDDKYNVTVYYPESEGS